MLGSCGIWLKAVRTVRLSGHTVARQVAGTVDQWWRTGEQRPVTHRGAQRHCVEGDVAGGGDAML